jgi:ABC-type sugar transport system permease subunit
VGRISKLSNGPLPYVLPAFLFMIITAVFPLIYNFYNSFFGFTQYERFETYVGLRNYVYLLSDEAMWNAILRSFLWAAGAVAGCYLLGLIAALVLNEKYAGRAFFRTSIFVPWLIPWIVVAVNWKFMLDPTFGIIGAVFRALGMASVSWLSDPRLALPSLVMVEIWKMFPFGMLVLLGGMQSIPKELYDAAKVDGASMFRAFVHITFPLLRTISVICCLFLTIYTFNAFTIPFVMTGGGPGKSTELITLYIYRLAFSNFDFGGAAGAAVVLFAIEFGFFAAYANISKRAGVRF